MAFPRVYIQDLEVSIPSSST